nr:PREDICTED: uncharacterized protein LOC109042953 [Bemisia tabaci]
MQKNDEISLRIDFETFNISQPTKGECKHDFLTVGEETVPNICGQNSGQHIYVNFDPEKTVSHVSVDTSSAVSFNRLWNLKVKQIPCNSKYQAPNGCLQYFDTTSGSVSSFNYGSKGQKSKIFPGFIIKSLIHY